MKKKSGFVQLLKEHPVKVLYILGVIGLVLWLLLVFATENILYATGRLREQVITLQDTEQYTLVNLEQTGDNSLISVTGDAQLLVSPGQLVRRVRLEAETSVSCEMDLYYHLPGSGYSASLRVWPTKSEDGSAYCYTLPLWAGQNFRLDPADRAPVEITLTRLVLNERPSVISYFIPQLWQLALLAVVPGLLACLITLRRRNDI